MNGTAKPNARARWITAARIALAVVGGYLLTNWSMACVALGLTLGLDMHRGDAVILASLLSFPTYVAAIVWAIGAPRFARVAVAFAGALVLSFVLAQWLAELGLAQSVSGGH
jgi:hypothetical protein